MIAALSANYRDDVFGLVASHAKVTVDKLSAATRFVQDLEFDIVDFQELRLAVEEKLDKNLPHFDGLKTIGDLFTLISSRR